MFTQSARDLPRLTPPGLQATRRVMWWLAQPWFDTTALWTMTRWHQYAPAQLDACHDIAVILAKTYAIEDGAQPAPETKF